MGKKFVILILTILTLFYIHADAQKIWIGPINGDWENDANWQPVGIPSGTDDVILENSFQKNNYKVTLPVTTVNVHSLLLEPTEPYNIELILPAVNKSSPGLIINEPGNSFRIKKGGSFRNSSGLTSGQSLQLNGLLSIYNDGSYIHNSRSSHATEIVARLSLAAGTEKGIFEFDVPGGSYPISFSNRVYGTLILSSAASGGTQVYNASGANLAIINGDFRINEGVEFNLDLTNDMIINGGYIQSGGILNAASQPNTNLIKIKGFVDQSPSGSITETSAGLPVIELCGDVNQQVSFGGSIQNSTTLKINNPQGITLINPLKLPYKLELINGVIKTTERNILNLLDNCIVTGGSADSFIDGPVMKTGDDDFEFPVGKQGDYAPVKISGAGGSVTDEFTAEYFLGNPALEYAATFESPPVVRISYLEYWLINRFSGSSVKKVSLSVGRYSQATALEKLVVVRWDSLLQSWRNEGNSFYTGISTGTLVSDGLSGFGAFTLGSTVAMQNPLVAIPLKINGVRKAGQVELTWDTFLLEETGYFEIQSSTDGIIYAEAGRMDAKKGTTRYSYIQRTNKPEEVYYRLKIKQKNGYFFYSNTLVIPYDQLTAGNLKIFPSPARNRLYLELQVIKKETIHFFITDASGQKVKSATCFLNEGHQKVSINLDELSAGIHYIHVYNKDRMIRHCRFIKM